MEKEYSILWYYRYEKELIIDAKQRPVFRKAMVRTSGVEFTFTIQFYKKHLLYIKFILEI